MAEGLNRARAAAKATRTVKCPTCGKTVKVSVQSGRIANHIGNMNDTCRESGQLPRGKG